MRFSFIGIIIRNTFVTCNHFSMVRMQQASTAKVQAVEVHSGVDEGISFTFLW